MKSSDTMKQLQRKEVSGTMVCITLFAFQNIDNSLSKRGFSNEEKAKTETGK